MSEVSPGSSLETRVTDLAGRVNKLVHPDFSQAVFPRPTNPSETSVEEFRTKKPLIGLDGKTQLNPDGTPHTLVDFAKANLPRLAESILGKDSYDAFLTELKQQSQIVEQADQTVVLTPEAQIRLVEEIIKIVKEKGCNAFNKVRRSFPEIQKTEDLIPALQGVAIEAATAQIRQWQEQETKEETVKLTGRQAAKQQKPRRHRLAQAFSWDEKGNMILAAEDMRLRPETGKKEADAKYEKMHKTVVTDLRVAQALFNLLGVEDNSVLTQKIAESENACRELVESIYQRGMGRISLEGEADLTKKDVSQLLIFKSKGGQEIDLLKEDEGLLDKLFEGTEKGREGNPIKRRLFREALLYSPQLSRELMKEQQSLAELQKQQQETKGLVKIYQLQLELEQLYNDHPQAKEIAEIEKQMAAKKAKGEDIADLKARLILAQKLLNLDPRLVEKSRQLNQERQRIYKAILFAFGVQQQDSQGNIVPVISDDKVDKDLVRRIQERYMQLKTVSVDGRQLSRNLVEANREASIQALEAAGARLTDEQKNKIMTDGLDKFDTNSLSISPEKKPLVDLIFDERKRTDASLTRLQEKARIDPTSTVISGTDFYMGLKGIEWLYRRSQTEEVTEEVKITKPPEKISPPAQTVTEYAVQQGEKIPETLAEAARDQKVSELDTRIQPIPETDVVPEGGTSVTFGPQSQVEVTVAPEQKVGMPAVIPTGEKAAPTGPSRPGLTPEELEKLARESVARQRPLPPEAVEAPAGMTALPKPEGYPWPALTYQPTAEAAAQVPTPEAKTPYNYAQLELEFAKYLPPAIPEAVKNRVDELGRNLVKAMMPEEELGRLPENYRHVILFTSAHSAADLLSPVIAGDERGQRQAVSKPENQELLASKILVRIINPPSETVEPSQLFKDDQKILRSKNYSPPLVEEVLQGFRTGGLIPKELLPTDVSSWQQEFDRRFLEYFDRLMRQPAQTETVNLLDKKGLDFLARYAALEMVKEYGLNGNVNQTTLPAEADNILKVWQTEREKLSQVLKVEQAPRKTVPEGGTSVTLPTSPYEVGEGERPEIYEEEAPIYFAEPLPTAPTDELIPLEPPNLKSPDERLQAERETPAELIEKRINAQKTYIDQLRNQYVLGNLDLVVQRMLYRLNGLSKGYVDELEEVNRQLPPMSEKVKLTVVIPAYNEEGKIERTLRTWLNQQETDGKPFDLTEVEFLVIVNKPNATKEFDRTAEIIKELKQKDEFSALNVHVIEKTFNFPDKDESITKDGKTIKVPKGVRMGIVYKYGADLAIIRNLTRHDKIRCANHLIRTGGADVHARNPRSLSRTFGWFDQYPQLEQYTSRDDYPPAIYQKLPLLHVARRLNEMMNLQHTKRQSHIGLGTYRAGIYAESGGFDPKIDIREEIDLSKRMRKIMAEGVGVEKTRKREAIINALDDPRRAIATLLAGKPIIYQYSDFDREDIRKIDLKQVLEQPVPPQAQLTPENLKKQVEAVFKLYFGLNYDVSGPQGLAEAYKTTERHLKLAFAVLGIDDFKISYNGDLSSDSGKGKEEVAGKLSVTIVNIDKLHQLIQEYANRPKEDWLTALDQTKIPTEAQPEAPPQPPEQLSSTLPVEPVLTKAPAPVVELLPAERLIVPEPAAATAPALVVPTAATQPPSPVQPQAAVPAGQPPAVPEAEGPAVEVPAVVAAPSPLPETEEILPSVFERLASRIRESAARQQEILQQAQDLVYRLPHVPLISSLIRAQLNLPKALNGALAGQDAQGNPLNTPLEKLRYIAQMQLQTILGQCSAAGDLLILTGTAGTGTAAEAIVNNIKTLAGSDGAEFLVSNLPAGLRALAGNIAQEPVRELLEKSAGLLEELIDQGKVREALVEAVKKSGVWQERLKELPTDEQGQRNLAEQTVEALRQLAPPAETPAEAAAGVAAPAVTPPTPTAPPETPPRTTTADALRNLRSQIQPQTEGAEAAGEVPAFIRRAQTQRPTPRPIPTPPLISSVPRPTPPPSGFPSTDVAVPEPIPPTPPSAEAAAGLETPALQTAADILNKKNLVIDIGSSGGATIIDGFTVEVTNNASHSTDCVDVTSTYIISGRATGTVTDENAGSVFVGDYGNVYVSKNQGLVHATGQSSAHIKETTSPGHEVAQDQASLYLETASKVDVSGDETLLFFTSRDTFTKSDFYNRRVQASALSFFLPRNFPSPEQVVIDLQHNYDVNRGYAVTREGNRTFIFAQATNTEGKTALAVFELLEQIGVAGPIVRNLRFVDGRRADAGGLQSLEERVLAKTGIRFLTDQIATLLKQQETPGGSYAVDAVNALKRGAKKAATRVRDIFRRRPNPPPPPPRRGQIA